MCMLCDAFLQKTTKTGKCVWTAQACTDCMWAHPVEGSVQPKIHEQKNLNSSKRIVADLTIGKGPFKDTYKSDVLYNKQNSYHELCHF